MRFTNINYRQKSVRRRNSAIVKSAKTSQNRCTATRHIWTFTLTVPAIRASSRVLSSVPAYTRALSRGLPFQYKDSNRTTSMSVWPPFWTTAKLEESKPSQSHTHACFHAQKTSSCRLCFEKHLMQILENSF